MQEIYGLQENICLQMDFRSLDFKALTNLISHW